MLNPYNNEFSRNDLLQASTYLKAKGLSDAQTRDIIDMMQRGEVEMSQRDGVTIQKREGNVPGAYVDSYQQQQDAYINSGLAQIQAKQGMMAPGFFPTTGDMGANFIPVVSPNTTVIQNGHNTAVKTDGTIVHY